MKYNDGQPIMLGDSVKLGETSGQVVAIIGADAFSSNYPKSEWGYLKTGLLIEFVEFGLVHYPEVPEQTIELVERASLSGHEET